jgi:hypothetical protein
LVAVCAYALCTLSLGVYWSTEPDPRPEAAPGAVTGLCTTDALVQTGAWLLEKPGGYLSNDALPPSWWLDNMAAFEFGVLVQVRDLSRVMRNYLSRSQSQSTEDPDLAVAEPEFNFSNDSWILPTTESRYRRALAALRRYRGRLADPAEPNAQFYARADNLREWLAVVETRLGSLSQRLSASVGQLRVDQDQGSLATPRPPEMAVQTPWFQIDDIFYEARGSAWALAHFLRAAEQDFTQVLGDKNAVVSVKQVVRELEAGLGRIYSPVILNGGGFGFFANHSLVLASYLSRAHSAVADLRRLLEEG